MAIICNRSPFWIFIKVVLMLLKDYFYKKREIERYSCSNGLNRLLKVDTLLHYSDNLHFATFNMPN